MGENTGAYIPFEMAAKALKRNGTNRLVVRVDSRRLVTDFPPAGLNADGVPTGGWWNYSGIQREVYLRKLDTVDFQKVLVAPGDRLRRPAPARDRGQDQPPERHARRAAGDDHRQVRQPEARTSAPRASARTAIAAFADTHPDREAAAVVAADPNLYDVSFTVRVGGKKVAGYSLHSGIRSIKVVQRAPDPQRPVPQRPRRRPARGLQGPGLRDRQRAPRAAGQRRQGARRDDPAHALPAASVHARAGGPARAC